jgi:HK97 family phage prohead protease
MDKDYIKNIEGAERRFAANGMKVEKRAADGENESFVVQGYAAIFNSPTQIGSWFREVILPGAFDDVLGQDVRCLFNHDPSLILGRTESGTLEIGVDTKGLWYRYTTPDRTYAKDLADAIDKGDVSQSSFAFRAKETVWREIQDELDLREIVKVETLYDVSPVTYPAYNDATVGKRAFDDRQAEKQREIDENAGIRTTDKGLTSFEAQVIINKNRCL